jgi:hypothetical protein
MGLEVITKQNLWWKEKSEIEKVEENYSKIKIGKLKNFLSNKR